MTGEWNKGRGRISGAAAVDAQSVNGRNLSWFGKELRWKIDTESQVATRLFFLSRYIGANEDKGPQGRIRILSSTGRTLVSRPLLKKKNEVVYLRMSKGKFVLSDLSGRKPQVIDNPVFPLTLAFGVVVRRPGEKADTRIQIEEDASLIPVVAELDPIEPPQGILTGLSTRFYLWYSGNHWHLRTTSRKYVRFRGIIRVLNGGLSSARQVGFERSQVDSWIYLPEKGEIHFAFKCGPSFDGLDFRIAGTDAMVEFDLQTLGKKNPNVVYIGREQKHPPAVPFAFPGKPGLKK